MLIATILPDCHPTLRGCAWFHGGWAHAASVSFGFRVASKRLGNHGRKRSTGSADAIFFLENERRRDNRRQRDAAGEEQPVRGLEAEQQSNLTLQRCKYSRNWLKVGVTGVTFEK